MWVAQPLGTQHARKNYTISAFEFITFLPSAYCIFAHSYPRIQIKSHQLSRDHKSASYTFAAGRAPNAALKNTEPRLAYLPPIKAADIEVKDFKLMVFIVICNYQYQYDTQGRLTEHKLTDYQNTTGITEVFAFDPASNRVPVKVADNTTDKTQINHGRPRELIQNNQRIRYTYDSHGRVLYKTTEAVDHPDKAPRTALQLQYNANNELDKSLRTQYQGNKVIKTLTEYHYDTFGRRIAKQSEHRNLVKNNEQLRQTNKTQHKHTHVLWDSNLPIQEYTDTHVYTTIYDQGSFEPVARLTWLRDDIPQAANDEPTAEERRDTEGWYGNNKPAAKTGIQIYHYHNDQLGTPNELTNSQGEVVWLADYEAWGNTAKVVWHEQVIDQIQVSQNELQPIRFQGQHFDEETGLHYNRFRYYDPDLGMFTSRDPIGLIGGNNVFQYAPNPTGWIDPLGLNRTIVNLGQGYKGGVDKFNKGGQATFEIHVYDKNGREVGMYGPNGWFNKHGLTGRPDGLPVDVENQCKGQAIDLKRRQGVLPDKGKANIKNDRWMKFLNITPLSTYFFKLLILMIL